MATLCAELDAAPDAMWEPYWSISFTFIHSSGEQSTLELYVVLTSVNVFSYLENQPCICLTSRSI